MSWAPSAGARVSFAVTGAALVTIIYLLIGFSVIAMADGQAGLAPPMLLAGAVFALLAVLVVLAATRVVPVAGAAL